MQTYRIRWEIDLYADSPKEAAETALAILRDPDSQATVFDVTDHNGLTRRIDITFNTDEEV